MKMCDDEIGQIVKIQPRLLQPQDRVADRVDQQHTLLPHNDHMCVFVVFGGNGIGRAEDDNAGHIIMLTENSQNPAYNLIIHSNTFFCYLFLYLTTKNAPSTNFFNYKNSSICPVDKALQIR